MDSGDLLPFKVELHYHLLGGVPVDIVYDAAKRKNGLPRGVSSLEDFTPHATTAESCSDLSGFLDVYYKNLALLSNDKQAIIDIVANFCKSQAQQGIYYTEVRFTPHKLAGDRLTIDDIMELVISNLEKGCKRYKIRVTVILSLLSRWDGDNDSRAKDILSLMEKYRHDTVKNPCGVVGIDVAGNEPERHPPVRDISFIKTFAQAKESGFGVTVHAGEGLDCGWDKVKYAIENECAMRIGHGYHLPIDAFYKNQSEAVKFMESLSNGKIHFEACPTSSVLTGACHMCNYNIKELQDETVQWDKHPIVYYLKYNIPFSLNTDDCAVFKCDMAQEMKIAKEKFGMTWEQIGKCFVDGAKASFLKGTEKEQFVEIVENRVAKWVQKMNAMNVKDGNNTAKDESKDGESGLVRDVVLVTCGVAAGAAALYWARKYLFEE